MTRPSPSPTHAEQRGPRSDRLDLDDGHQHRERTGQLRTGRQDLSPGWQVELSETYVTIDGRHCSSSTNCDRKSVQVQITVPANAKSGIDFEITMYVNSQGVTLDEVTATVTVAAGPRGPWTCPRLPDGAVRAMGLVPHRAHQHGKHAGQLRLSSCDPNIPDTCEDTKWDSRYKDGLGNDISQVTIQSEETVQVFLEVLVSDNINNNSESFDARIGIVGTNILMEETLTVTVSNFNYSMSVAFQEPGEDPTLMRYAYLPEGPHPCPSWWQTPETGALTTRCSPSREWTPQSSGRSASTGRYSKATRSRPRGRAGPGHNRLRRAGRGERHLRGHPGLRHLEEEHRPDPSYVELVMDIRSIHDLQVDIESSTPWNPLGRTTRSSRYSSRTKATSRRRSRS